MCTSHRLDRRSSNSASSQFRKSSPTMATTTDDKGQVKLLPADCLFAIYDINTHILYLAARGSYFPPTLTSFARQTWIGGIKYAFEGFYDNLDDKPIPTEIEFAEEFSINLPEKINEVHIVTADGTKTVKILRVPLLLS